MALHIAAFAQSLPERAESSFRLGRSKYAAGRQNTDSDLSEPELLGAG